LHTTAHGMGSGSALRLSGMTKVLGVGDFSAEAGDYQRQRFKRNRIHFCHRCSQCGSD
jgi:hypothetical protein